MDWRLKEQIYPSASTYLFPSSVFYSLAASLVLYGASFSTNGFASCISSVRDGSLLVTSEIISDGVTGSSHGRERANDTQFCSLDFGSSKTDLFEWK